MRFGRKKVRLIVCPISKLMISIPALNESVLDGQRTAQPSRAHTPSMFSIISMFVFLTHLSLVEARDYQHDIAHDFDVDFSLTGESISTYLIDNQFQDRYYCNYDQ
jgi:hypothetical protein